MDEFLLTLKNTFSDDFENIKPNASEVQQFSSANSDYFELSSEQVSPMVPQLHNSINSSGTTGNSGVGLGTSAVQKLHYSINSSGTTGNANSGVGLGTSAVQQLHYSIYSSTRTASAKSGVGLGTSATKNLSTQPLKPDVSTSGNSRS